MSKETLNAKSWSAEFCDAAAALQNVIDLQGDEAPFLPENSHLIREIAKHAPPELQGYAQDLLRQLNFCEASREMRRIADVHGQDALRLPEYSSLTQKMMLNAPPELMAVFEQKAREMGLIPKTTHVDEQGQPVYSLEQVSLQLGVSVAELEEQLQSTLDSKGLVYTGPVSSVH